MKANIVGRTGRGAGATLPLCFVAAMTEGWDIQSMGLAAPRLAPAMHLAHDQMTLVITASTLGLFVGAITLGRLADRIGRRWTLIGSLVVFSLFSLATVEASGFTSLLVIRLLAGLGLGGGMPNFVALAAEAVGEQRRGRAVMLISAGLPFGGMVGALVAAVGSWQAIFLFGGLAPLALAGAMVLALPESEAFRNECKGRSLSTLKAEAYSAVLFRGGRAAGTLSLWAASFTALSALYLLLGWLPSLMVAKGVSKSDASLVSVLFNLGGGCGLIALAFLLEQRWRSWVIVVWYLGMAASLLILAVAAPTLAAAGPAGLLMGLFISSAPVCLYGLAPRIYPVAMRGTGVGASVAVGRLGAIAGPFVAGLLIGTGAGPASVLLALLPVAVVAAATTLILLRHSAAPIAVVDAGLAGS